MGRETKFLLALLGLLVGVFLGVVSLKLFVPRPPAGTGPDVHADIATVEAQDLVEPPAFVPPPALAVTGDEASGGRTSRFGVDSPAVELPPQDPFVRPASFEAPLATAIPAAADLLPPSTVPPPPPLPAPPSPPPPTPPMALPPAEVVEQAPQAPVQPPTAEAMSAEVHLAGPGDSWWSLAEQAYGDGRFYRALFAWNKALDPRVSLTPGTRLELPPAVKLEMAWPALVPRK